MSHSSDYKNIIFDFDGVLADSNFIKESAISKATRPFCDVVYHQEFVSYFTAHNGVPREMKVEIFFNKEETKKILQNYEEYLKSEIDGITLTDGATSYLKRVQEKHHLYILSGGAFDEIEQILRNHSVLNYFKLVLSGPKTKETNIKDIDLVGETLFIGDSKKDYEVALECGFDFVFMYGYTQFSEWQEFFLDKKIKTVKNFEELLND